MANDNLVLTSSIKKHALALVNEKRLVEARSLYSQICQIDPSDTEAWFRQGTIAIELNSLDQAEICFQHAIKLEPRLAIAYYNLGRALELQGKYDGAILAYRQMLQITPHVEAYINIGVIYTKQGKFEEALEAYREAQRIEPDNLRLIAAEAGIYEKQGQFDRAYALIYPLIKAGRETPELAFVLASISRHFNCRQEAIDTMERLLTRVDSSKNDNSEIYMRFALGKLLDATGNYDRAFHHFSKGNNLSNHVFRIDAYVSYVDDLIRTFSTELFQRSPRAKNSDSNLIFIIGMPRSGTTLVEQILASHSQVYGCGELPDIGDMAMTMPKMLGTKERYPQCVVSLTKECSDSLVQRYNQRVQEISNRAKFTIDKMPLNFQHLGLIALLFPAARIIHCVRDPLDTCLSNYFQLYDDNQQPHSYDLACLGRFYSEYQRLMQHWRTVVKLPIMEVQYENLVANQESVTRDLVAFCGLPWDERCLRFHESKRVVITTSYDQVRQPLYQRSVGRWRHYERFLGPLINGLNNDSNCPELSDPSR